ncbi:MAG: ribonuclease activity regulator RraA [Gammaproteobacteria bacterium]|nr:ribonuclease activity regulator RraA [Gammaproteobacteria bacterium]
MSETMAQLRKVSTATLTMVLIKNGIRSSWLRGPKPLDPIDERVVGPAFTVRFVPGRDDLCDPASYAADNALRDAIEAAPAGSVLVIDGRGHPDAGTLGDILIARLRERGVMAAVTDSPVRDVDEIRKVGLPVLACGVAAPPSIAGLAYAGYGDMIGCGGVAVCPGDLMVCDNDGAVVIPAALAAKVAAEAIQQELFETYVQERVQSGASVMGLYPPDEQCLRDFERWTQSLDR